MTLVSDLGSLVMLGAGAKMVGDSVKGMRAKPREHQRKGSMTKKGYRHGSRVNVGQKKELLVGYHKVKGLYPLNKYKSRYAYQLSADGKKIKGEWALDSANINKGTYTYKRVN